MTEESPTAIERLSKSVGMSFSKERKNDLYYGRPPKGVYPGRSLENIHDVGVSADKVKRLYGMKPAEKAVEFRAEHDSKKGLVRELVEETSFTRKEAEQFVDQWMLKNDLVEKDDPIMGKVIVPRGCA